MQNHQTSSFHQPSLPFTGIHFELFGFDPITKSQVSRKLVDGGGVDAGQYGPNCTHVIVHKLTYDDPVCVDARRDGKKLVSSLWVEHSFDVGEPVKTTDIMYRPVKDLLGIPGAKSLIICLTGYQRGDREDIMTMVALMGAQFSKPLIANKVTHLICFKFEGEKYVLAKKMNRIKLINHKWLEDCLKAWKIVSEEDYSNKSGYELAMEAEAKDSEEEAQDSEDEAEGVSTRQNEGKIASPHHSLLSKREFPRTLLNTSASKGFGNAEGTVSVTMKTKITSDQLPNFHEIKSNNENVMGVTCEPSNLYEGTTSGSAAVNRNIAVSTSANKSPLNEAKKVVSSSWSKEEPTRTTPPTMYTTTSNTGNAKRLNTLNLSDAYNMSSLAEKVNEEQNLSSCGKRKMDRSCGSVKRQRMDHNEEASNRQSPHVESAFEESKIDPHVEMSNHLSDSTNIPCMNDGAATSPAEKSPSNITEWKNSSSRGKNVNVPISKTPTSKIVQGEDLVAVRRPLNEYTETSLVAKFDSRDVGMEMQGIEKSYSAAAGFDLQKSGTVARLNSKPIKRKSIGKKFSAPNQILDKTKTVNQKGSIYLKNKPRNDVTTSMVDIKGLADDKDLFTYKKFEKVTQVAKSGSEKEMEVNDGLEVENMFGNKSSCMDDETEPPEDQDEACKETLKDGELKNAVDIVMEEKAEGDLHDVVRNNDIDDDITQCGNLYALKSKVPVDKSVDTDILVSDQTSRGKEKGKKRTISVKEATDKKALKKKELASENKEKPEIREEATLHRAGKFKRNVNDGKTEDTVDIVMEEKADRERPNVDQDDDIDDEMIECGSVIMSIRNQVPIETSDDTENPVCNKTSRRKKNGMKGTALSVKEVTDTNAAKKKELVCENDDGEPAVREETTREAKSNVNDLENSMEVKGAEDASNDPEQKNDEKDDTEKKGPKKNKCILNKTKKDATFVVEEVTVKKTAKKKKLTSQNNNKKAEIREEATGKTTGSVNDLENSMESTTAGVCSDPEHKNGVKDDIENVVNTKATKSNKRVSNAKKDAALTVKEVTNSKAVKKGIPTSSGCSLEAQKENIQGDDQSTGNKQVIEKITPKPVKVNSDSVTAEPMWFILTGHSLQRREFQQIIRKLKGRVCRVSHQWSYQATHYIVPDPIRRTEKFCAAAASGRWIMKTDYLSASNQAGRFLAEEAYEWHKNGLSEDGQINLEAPRKWRLLKEKTGHGAFYGMRIIVYGECIAPSLDTLKRVVKAGDGTIVATSPPYTRFLKSDIDFAVISPGLPPIDIWVKEFLRHEIPCISVDYLVDYVCKPGYPLDRHIQCNTNDWAERSYNNLQNHSKEVIIEPRTPDNDDVACEVCGSRDRGEEMLMCGDESGSNGCGVGTHFDCCDPPLDDIPKDDWFCPKCIKAKNIKTTKKSSRKKCK